MQDIDWGAAINATVTNLLPVCVPVLVALVSRQAVRMWIKYKGFRWRDVALAAVILGSFVTWVMIREESFECRDQDPVSGACLDFFHRDTRSATDQAADALTLLLLLGTGAVAGFSEGFGRKSPPLERNYAAINTPQTAQPPQDPDLSRFNS